MTLPHEKHVLACALLVEKQQGERAPVYIAEQIGRLVFEGDWAGVAMWKKIAACMGNYITETSAYRAAGYLTAQLLRRF